jgi:hypothetical protein
MSTRWVDRFTDALQVLCGERPPADLVQSWLDPVADCQRLQDWVGDHMHERLRPHSQCISLIDAAHVIADQPEEGDGHGMRGEEQGR